MGAELRLVARIGELAAKRRLGQTVEHPVLMQISDLTMPERLQLMVMAARTMAAVTPLHRARLMQRVQPGRF